MYRKFFAIFIFLAVVGFFMLKSESQSGTNSLISPIAHSPLVKSIFKSGLEDVVKKELEGTTGQYSIYIKNLKTNEEYELDSHKLYEPASLYKLWVMGAVYEEVKNGTLKTTEVLSNDVKSLNEKFGIDEENAELTEGDFSMTVQQALNQMITISHNYSALLLMDRIRRVSVVTFMKENDFLESTLGTEPKTSARDIGLFYEKLYNGKIIDSNYSSIMMDILSKQTFNDRIPKYLPDNYKVAHKTGELGQVKHDAGVVFSPKGDYVIVLLSQSKSPKGAAEREALLSKAIFDYFQK